MSIIPTAIRPRDDTKCQVLKAGLTNGFAVWLKREKLKGHL